MEVVPKGSDFIEKKKKISTPNPATQATYADSE